MAKNSVEVYGAEGRSNLLYFDPSKLTLVTDEDHPLYDPRVHDPVDPALVASIKIKGVIEPVIIWKDPETGLTCVVDGRGRTRACLEANRQLALAGETPKQVPAIIGKGAARDVMAVMVLANEGRREPTAAGRAKMAQRLMVQGYSEDQVAIFLHCSTQTVTSYLQLAESTQAVRSAAEAGEISTTVAYTLAKLPPAEQREQLTTMIEAAKGESGVRKRTKKMLAAVGKERKAPTRKEIKVFLADVSGPTVDEDYCNTATAILDWVLGNSKKPRIARAK